MNKRSESLFRKYNSERNIESLKELSLAAQREDINLFFLKKIEPVGAPVGRYYLCLVSWGRKNNLWGAKNHIILDCYRVAYKYYGEPWSIATWDVLLSIDEGIDWIDHFSAFDDKQCIVINDWVCDDDYCNTGETELKPEELIIKSMPDYYMLKSGVEYQQISPLNDYLEGQLL